MTTRTRGELFLLTTTVIWGSTFVAMKIGLRDVDAMTLIAARFAAASLFFLIVFPRLIFPIPQRHILQGAILGLLLFLGFAAQTYGLYSTTASKSAFITSMMVVFAPLFQIVIEKRAPTYGNALGIFIVCFGLWLLTNPESSAFTTGDGLTLLCAVLFGLYLVSLDLLSRKIPLVQLTFLQLASCAVFSWSSALSFGTLTVGFTGPAISAIAYLTVFATILTTFVQTRFQKETTPTRAAIIFSVEPVFATCFAWVLLGEAVGTPGLIGGGLIVAGVLLSQVSDVLPVLRNSIRFARRTHSH